MEKKVCIECDPDLTKEQKTQLEELPKLGLPDTRKVNLGAEQEQVIKNKGRVAIAKINTTDSYYFQFIQKIQTLCRQSL